MTALARIEGRRLFTKLSDGDLCTDEFKDHTRKAERGSQQLRDAILKAKGYSIPKPEPEVAAKIIPIFKRPARRLGRPRGSFKVRQIDTRIVKIMEVLAGHFGITVEGMMSPDRSFYLSHPRQIAMYLARQTTEASLNDIGFHFGRRDHTTVIHAIREVETRIEFNDLETIDALVKAREAGVA